MGAMDSRNLPYPDLPSPAGPDADLGLLLEAVRAAGAVAMEFYCCRPKSTVKPDGTQVSEADHAADGVLRDKLLGARPDYGWLSEESGDGGLRLQRDRVWVVDPIDGTRAFLQERPQWTVAAALVVDGRPVAGAVFNPATDEFFHAAKGRGARLNGEAIRVRDPVPLENARLFTAKGLPRRDIWTRPWPPVEISWVNSMAYRLALVAAGMADATVSLSFKYDWDLAAAELLVQEAGGLVTTHLGEAYRYNQTAARQPSVVAAGPALHAALIERTSEAKL